MVLTCADYQLKCRAVKINDIDLCGVNKMKIFGKKITWRFRKANSYRMVTLWNGRRIRQNNLPWFETYKTTEPKTGIHGKAFNAGRLYVHIGRP